MKQTSIEWCDHTWNPWRGCTKVSPGCANCYAEKMAKRNPKVLGKWGKGAPRVPAKNWGDPVKWDKEFSKADFFTRLQGQPRPNRPKVFPSFCDWLDDEVPVELLARFLQLIQDTPNIDWLLLTKRPELWEHRLRAVCGYCQSLGGDWTLDPVWQFANRWCPWNGIHRFEPPTNVWIGTSVEDQNRAEERIPELLKIPARLRFLSVEPLLGGIDLMTWLGDHEDRPLNWGEIDWVIVGGESGPQARQCNVDWIRSIVRQCDNASVPCFVKQLGKNPCGYWVDGAAIPLPDPLWRLRVKHPKGGEPSEWPQDLRVRQFPEVKP